MKVIRKPGPGANQLKKLLNSIEPYTSKAGWFESAKYPNGTPVAYVAAIQEFGVPSQSIPPRSFMRPTIAARGKYWLRVAAEMAKRLVKGEATLYDIMNFLGTTASADIQKAITKVKTPPLSYVTLLLRKQRRAGKVVLGADVGEAHKTANFVGPRLKKDKSANVRGVSTKPLVDTGLLLATTTSVTERKK